MQKNIRPFSSLRDVILVETNHHPSCLSREGQNAFFVYYVPIRDFRRHRLFSPQVKTYG